MANKNNKGNTPKPEVTLEQELGLDAVLKTAPVETVETETKETKTETTELPAEIVEANKIVDENTPSGFTRKVGADDGTVFDEKGHALFRRKTVETKEEAPVKKKERQKFEYKERQAFASPVVNAANAATLTFPTDRWGVTKDVKKAVVSAASRIAGDAAKKALFDDTIKTLLAHVEAKFKVDAKKRAELVTESDEE